MAITRDGNWERERENKTHGIKGLVSPQPPRVFRARFPYAFPTVSEPGTGYLRSEFAHHCKSAFRVYLLAKVDGYIEREWCHRQTGTANHYQLWKGSHHHLHLVSLRNNCSRYLSQTRELPVHFYVLDLSDTSLVRWCKHDATFQSNGQVIKFFMAQPLAIFGIVEAVKAQDRTNNFKFDCLFGLKSQSWFLSWVLYWDPFPWVGGGGEILSIFLQSSSGPEEG